MNVAKWMQTDMAELAGLVARISEEPCEALCRTIIASTRVFVAGQGRSGLIMRMAAVRLMQVGLTVHVVGDATTPPIQKGDLLLITSASGETPGPVIQAQRAVAAGASVALLTAAPASRLGSLANTVIHIPGETTKINLQIESRLPLATTLEQATLIVLDAVVARVAELLNQTPSSMMARHANLE